MPPFDTQPPGQVRALRAFGLVMIGLTVVATVTTTPHPGLSGRGLVVSLGLALFLACVVVFNPWRGDRGPTPVPVPHTWSRVAGFLASGLVLMASQPRGFAVAGLYIAVVLAGLRLPARPAAGVAAVGIVSWCVVAALAVRHPAAQITTAVFGVIPWFLVMTMVRRLRLGQLEAEELVDELRESRAAQTEAAAQAERGRIAREMHDVLAHSLSALALQLEGARLLARDRGADAELVASLERAHHLAASGLEEARRAISAMHGDDLPGPAGLPLLAEAFAEHSGARCESRIEGTPRALGSEASLAVYRTAQEALTNVRKHAAADTVELTLRWAPEAVTLVVADHGPGAPVAVGVATAGGGYGLSGMRERAELLGGRLEAGPTADGFRVELWLPA